jgi:hypothetical protein
MSLAARHWESAAVILYFVSTRSRTGLSSHYRTLGPKQDPLLFFSNLCTEEHRLRQAKALLLMRRTCNLLLVPELQQIESVVWHCVTGAHGLQGTWMYSRKLSGGTSTVALLYATYVDILLQQPYPQLLEKAQPERVSGRGAGMSTDWKRCLPLCVTPGSEPTAFKAHVPSCT